MALTSSSEVTMQRSCHRQPDVKSTYAEMSCLENKWQTRCMRASADYGTFAALLPVRSQPSELYVLRSLATIQLTNIYIYTNSVSYFIII